MSQASTSPTSRKWPSRMRRSEASAYLLEEHGVRLAPATLAKLAVIGGGPAFRRDGRFPLYDLPVLANYAHVRVGPLRTSTSDQQVV
jgi:hypothetical protein